MKISAFLPLSLSLYRFTLLFPVMIPTPTTIIFLLTSMGRLVGMRTRSSAKLVRMTIIAAASLQVRLFLWF